MAAVGCAASPGKRLSRDHLFAARMAYCAPKGIPLSTFLAWPQEDQDAALAWQWHESLRCSCGAHEADPPGTWQAVPVLCAGHAEIEKAQGAPGAALPGAVIRLVRR